MQALFTSGIVGMKAVHLFSNLCFEITYIRTQVSFTSLVPVWRMFLDDFVSLCIDLCIDFANVCFGVRQLLLQNIAPSFSLSDYVWVVFLAKAFVDTGPAVCRSKPVYLSLRSNGLITQPADCFHAAGRNRITSTLHATKQPSQCGVLLALLLVGQLKLHRRIIARLLFGVQTALTSVQLVHA